MSELVHKFVNTNGIKMHVVEAGKGFPVVFCHGFPELWYSWRHQLRALGDAGFRAIAPDQRGYGETDCPQPVEAYQVRAPGANCARRQSQYAVHAAMASVDAGQSRTSEDNLGD